MKAAFSCPILCAALVLTVVASTPLMMKRLSALDFVFEVRLQSSTQGVAQIFYDIGKGMREEDSAQVQIAQSTAPTIYRFRLPSGELYALRFDPIDREGAVTFSDAKILDSHGKLIKNIAGSQFRAAQQISSLLIANDSVRMITVPRANDPMLAVVLDAPISLKTYRNQVLLEITVTFCTIFFICYSLLLCADIFCIQHTETAMCSIEQQDQKSLIAFSSGYHQALLCIITFLFISMVFLHLHGWSISAWHDYIDQSPKSEILLGEERAIRVDDWLLDLPMILAQVSHSPQFPVVNENVADGQNMLAPIHVPARSFTWLLRPFTWGFLLSRDIGLSFLWCSLLFGLFYAFFLVFMLISRNNFFISSMSSLFLLFSPYFQFWSLHKSPIAIFWALSFVFFAYVLGSEKRWQIIVAGLFLGYSLAGMVLGHIYPPILVPLGWLLLFVVVTWFLDRYLEFSFRRFICYRLVSLFLALGVVVAFLLSFYIDTKEVFHLITQTSYPGRRFSSGGGLPVWAFFSNNLFAFLIDKDGAWLGNICESSSFIFVFPIILILSISYWIATHRLLDRWTLVLMGYIISIGLYTYVGFPDALAKMTFLGYSFSYRTQLGFGLSNALMLVSAMSQYKKIEELSVKCKWVSIFTWVAILFLFGLYFHIHFPVYKLGDVFLFSLLNGLLVYCWLILKRRNLFLTVLTSASILVSISFNPLVRGGQSYLFDNPLSKKILEIEQADRSSASWASSRWVVIGNMVLGNLPRIIGIKSLGGYHGHPHLELWKKFDPAGKFFSVYNQCAFINFSISNSLEAQFKSPLPGHVDVQVNPLSDVFEKVGVKYFLAVGEPTIHVFQQSGRFEKLFELNHRAIFRRG